MKSSRKWIPWLRKQTGSSVINSTVKMKQNLDELKGEILKHLIERGFVVFHGQSRAMEPSPTVFWDCESYPDYKMFLQSAERTDVKIVVFHSREFSAGVIDEAIDAVKDADLTLEEQRSIARRLRELRKYAGFTCAIELSFDVQSRVYAFDLRTEWYDELSNILATIDSELLDEPGNEADEEGPIGGYFSRN